LVCLHYVFIWVDPLRSRASAASLCSSVASLKIISWHPPLANLAKSIYNYSQL